MAIFHEYPYTNFHDLNLDWIIKIVKELKAIVDQIDIDEINARFTQINAELSEHSSDIAALEASSTQAAAAIASLQTLVSGIQVDIAQIHSQIDGVIDQLTAAVATLQGELTDLETDYNGFKAATNLAIDALNQAAFDPSQIVMSSIPFNFGMNMLNANANGIRIVVDGSGSQSDSIKWVDAGDYTHNAQPINNKLLHKFKMPEFERSGNPAHLIIPNVIPYLYNQGVNVRLSYNLYFYANRYFYEQHGDNIWIRKTGAINTVDLLADGGVQQATINDDRMCFFDMELHANQETGAYDLWLYNGRDGHYCTIDQFKFSSILISTVDLGNTGTWEGAQRYFNLLNAYGTNAYDMMDIKDATNLQTAKNYADSRDSYTEQTCKLTDVLDKILLLEPEDASVTVDTDKSRFCKYQFSTATKAYTVTKMMVELQLTVSGLTQGVSVNVGQLLYNGSAPFSMNDGHYLDLAVMNTAATGYAVVSSDGTVALAVRDSSGTVPASVSMRVYGYVYDVKIETL